MSKKVSAVTVNNLMALVGGFVLFHRGERRMATGREAARHSDRMSQVLKQQNECRNQNRSNMKGRWRR